MLPFFSALCLCAATLAKPHQLEGPCEGHTSISGQISLSLSYFLPLYPGKGGQAHPMWIDGPIPRSCSMYVQRVYIPPGSSLLLHAKDGASHGTRGSITRRPKPLSIQATGALCLKVGRILLTKQLE